MWLKFWLENLIGVDYVSDYYYRVRYVYGLLRLMNLSLNFKKRLLKIMSLCLMYMMGLRLVVLNIFYNMELIVLWKLMSGI